MVQIVNDRFPVTRSVGIPIIYVTNNKMKTRSRRRNAHINDLWKTAHETWTYDGQNFILYVLVRPEDSYDPHQFDYIILLKNNKKCSSDTFELVCMELYYHILTCPANKLMHVYANGHHTAFQNAIKKMHRGDDFRFHFDRTTLSLSDVEDDDDDVNSDNASHNSIVAVQCNETMPLESDDDDTNLCPYNFSSGKSDSDMETPPTLV